MITTHGIRIDNQEACPPHHISQRGIFFFHRKVWIHEPNTRPEVQGNGKHKNGKGHEHTNVCGWELNVVFGDLRKHLLYVWGNLSHERFFNNMHEVTLVNLNALLLCLVWFCFRLPNEFTNICRPIVLGLTISLWWLGPSFWLSKMKLVYDSFTDCDCCNIW